MIKHAFLIEAHNNLVQLKKLLKCLDYEYNDIFLHVDAKSKELIGIEKFQFEKAGYYIVPAVRVNWGGYSQIEAELRLLETAAEKMQYARYHLISGVDLPLVSQKKLHDYFDAMSDIEFVHYDYKYSDDLFGNRMGLYHLFRNKIDRNQKALVYSEKMLLGFQKILGVNRIRNLSIELGKGANWFSITDACARYVLSRREWIYKTFKYTNCCDEVFLQTIVLNSPFKDKRFYDQKEKRYGNKRAVDWNRGNPYTYRKEDFNWLISSGYMFGRKFNTDVDSEIVEMIVNYVTDN